MFAVTVRLEIRAAQTEMFLPHMRKQAADSLKEPGCHRFDVCLGEKSRTQIFLYEVYQDRKAFDSHLKSAHFLRFDQAVSDMVVSKHVHTWLLDAEVAAS